MDGRLTRRDWIEAGLAALAEGGLDSVRIEVLAKRLTVTKGGFYWHFRDRQDLLQAMLAAWRDGREQAISRQIAELQGSAAERLGALVRRYVENANPRGVAIELAIRDWARRDAEAAAAAAAVDRVRLDEVGRLYRDLGLAAEAATARAFLFYAFVFGQSLMVLPDPAERRRLVALSLAALQP